MSKAYVLLSGGIDSSTALALAQEKHGSVVAISVHYGQRHNNELMYAKNIANRFSVPHLIIDLQSAIGVGGLTDQNLDIPDKTYAELPQGVSPTYVPNRNMLLLSMLVSKAVADPEAEVVYYGAHAEDSKNDAYPDCSAAFVNHMRRAIHVATYTKIRLEVPFLHMTKAEVVTEGERLGVPWALTWSCYKGGIEHCGACPTCYARIEAFKIAGVDDPTVYAS